MRNYLAFLMPTKRTGYVCLSRNYGGRMTPWYFGYANEHGLWSLSLHGFGLVFEIIGPFKTRKGASHA